METWLPVGYIYGVEWTLCGDLQDSTGGPGIQTTLCHFGGACSMVGLSADFKNNIAVLAGLCT